MTPLDLAQDAAVLAIFLLVAFPVHEFSHAWAAYRLGDSTARWQGRLTLNPIVHFDPIGGSLLAISIVLAGMALIAWVLFRTKRGDFGPEYFSPVDFVGLYWHIVDLVWIFHFPLLYLIGNNP